MFLKQYSLIRLLLAAVLPLYVDPPAGGGTPPPDDNGGGPPGGGTTPPAGGGTDPWYHTFQNKDVQEWVKSQNNAYPTPESMAEKAWNLEKFIGADKAGRGVVAPKADAKPEEWQAFYRKVGGVPEKADGYKVPEPLVKDPLAMKFREHAHKTGLPPMFFDSVMGFITAEGKTAQESSLAEFERRGKQEMTELQAEWAGPAWDQNMEHYRRGVKTFIPHENADQLEDIVTRMEGAIGTKLTMKIFAAVGSGIGEHAFHGGEGGGGSPTGMTPEGARVRIRELQADKEWGKAFANGDADKKAEWERLHKIGYPEQQG